MTGRFKLADLFAIGASRETANGRRWALGGIPASGLRPILSLYWTHEGKTNVSIQHEAALADWTGGDGAMLFNVVPDGKLIAAYSIGTEETASLDGLADDETAKRVLAWGAKLSEPGPLTAGNGDTAEMTALLEAGTAAIGGLFKIEAVLETEPRMKARLYHTSTPMTKLVSEAMHHLVDHYQPTSHRPASPESLHTRARRSVEIHAPEPTAHSRAAAVEAFDAFYAAHGEALGVSRQMGRNRASAFMR